MKYPKSRKKFIIPVYQKSFSFGLFLEAINITTFELFFILKIFDDSWQPWFQDILTRTASS